MDNHRLRALALVIGVVALLASIHAQQPSAANPAGARATTSASKPGSEIKTADFAWFTGRWRGNLKGGKFTAEQICTHPDKGEMLCLFRLHDGKQYIMYELYSLFDTPSGVELRSLHFDPNLEEKQAQKPLVMKLARYSDSEVVFEGLPASDVKTSTLFRHGPNSMDGVIMMVDQSQPHIEVKWTKIPY